METKNKYVLTKYDMTKIIGTRASQLDKGATPMIDITGLDNAYIIAEKEFEMKKIPFYITRTLPTGKTKKIDPNKCIFKSI